MDNTGRAAKERVSGELTLEKTFGGYVDYGEPLFFCTIFPR